MNHPASGSLRRTSLALCVVLSLCSCGRLSTPDEPRLSVGATLQEIEWVIVDTHDLGVGGQWVAKLTPEADGGTIKELIEAIENAAPGEPTRSEAAGFIVFKLKAGGIRAFNFCDVVAGREVEIRPAFWSRALARRLIRIRDNKTGWDRDNSLPKVKVKEIQAWRYEHFIDALWPNSPGFDRLAEAGCEVLGALDPRLCTQDWGSGRDPRQGAPYQGEPQFILFLEKPLDIYKLTLRWGKPGEGPQIDYETFTSSVIGVYVDRSHLGIGGYYVAFRSDKDESVWYAWNLIQAAEAARTMGRPDGYKAFKKLLAEYEKVGPRTP